MKTRKRRSKKKQDENLIISHMMILKAGKNNMHITFTIIFLFPFRSRFRSFSDARALRWVDERCKEEWGKACTYLSFMPSRYHKKKCWESNNKHNSTQKKTRSVNFVSILILWAYKTDVAHPYTTSSSILSRDFFLLFIAFSLSLLLL